MKEEFNENPFRADTKVLVLSTGSEAADWFCNNCDQCVKGKHGEETCDIVQELIRSAATDGYGYLPLRMVWRVGANYNPLYQSAKLWRSCLERQTGDEPF